MKIVRNRIIPFGRFAAMNLCGILFVKQDVMLNARLENHERIHTAQMLELGVVLFYLLYVLEWMVRLPLNRFNNFRAYRSISFEREAYEHDADLTYLSHRRHFAEWRKTFP